MVSLVVGLVGLVLYAIDVHPKATEIGRIMFWTGLLSFLMIGAQVSLVVHR